MCPTCTVMPCSQTCEVVVAASVELFVTQVGEKKVMHCRNS